MKLGFVSAILPDCSLEEVIAFAADEGFACVELMCWPVGKAERRYAGVTHLDVTVLDAVTLERVRGLCTDAGVEISGLGYYPNPLAIDAEEARASALARSDPGLLGRNGPLTGRSA
jgi:sugar phosphate isomerase/epimerase